MTTCRLGGDLVDSLEDESAPTWYGSLAARHELQDRLVKGVAMLRHDAHGILNMAVGPTHDSGLAIELRPGSHRQ